MLKPAALIKLPQMRKEFKAMRKELAELAARSKSSQDDDTSAAA